MNSFIRELSGLCAKYSAVIHPLCYQDSLSICLVVGDDRRNKVDFVEINSETYEDLINPVVLEC